MANRKLNLKVKYDFKQKTEEIHVQELEELTWKQFSDK